MPSSPPAATATLEPTPQPAEAVLLAPGGANPALAAALQPALEKLSAQAGWNFSVRQELASSQLGPHLRVVVAVAPDPGLKELAAAAPETQFLAIGIPGLETAANLSLIGPQGARPDEIGFAAGFLAATVTAEWRVGVLSVSDTPDGIAARQGFINGVIYNCGLCRQTYPPYYTYPMYVELPAESTLAEWEAAASALKDKSVKTLFIAPGAGDGALLEFLADAGFQLIGTGAPSAAVQGQWVASIQTGFLPAVETLWPELLAGRGGASLPLDLTIEYINPALFSPGRQRMMTTLLADLMGGYVDTGAAGTSTANP